MLKSVQNYLITKYIELSEGVPRTGVPIKTKKIWQDLQQLQRPYIIVSQLDVGEKPRRKISEIYP